MKLEQMIDKLKITGAHLWLGKIWEIDVRHDGKFERIKTGGINLTEAIKNVYKEIYGSKET